LPGLFGAGCGGCQAGRWQVRHRQEFWRSRPRLLCPADAAILNTISAANSPITSAPGNASAR
jgi:hypothetical protein